MPSHASVTSRRAIEFALFDDRTSLDLDVDVTNVQSRRRFGDAEITEPACIVRRRLPEILMDSTRPAALRTGLDSA